ncbi:TonB-dependent receptor [Sphingomonas glacialis]|uniref:TonB-dependent receptor n=1 Tax=Sphingomonas glacialis TaxID=658225 RepID=A0A502FHP6_9SPHN|nr:TonB-dependent receptor [Sphingomonas glacialis]TPG48990.1 TonB-dependent receptor [Sphingomonas glacialis]
MSKSHVAKAALLLGTAFGAIASIGSASAQDAAAPVAAVQAAPESDSLGDIVVTAQRRSENLQKVPVSVGVLSGADLRTYTSGGSDTLLELANRVPGLYAETTTGKIFPRFYIRGLGNIDFYLGASQPVSIIQDDVVLEHVVLKSNPVYDVNQIEVLRGPQGTLFGRNTTAGIIKFDTNRPTNEFTGRATASYGSYNTVSVDAGVGGPIVKDVLSFRVSGLYQRRDNWIDNTYTGPSDDGTVGGKDKLGGFEEKDIRVQLMLTPPETGFTGLLSAHARDYSGTSTIFHRGAILRGSNDISAAPRASVALDEGGGNRQAYKTYGGSFNAKNDFGAVTLTSITAYETTAGYSRGDTDGGAASNFAGGKFYGESQGRVRDLDQLSEEVRLASNGTGRFKWQIGGIYFESRDTTEFDQRGFFLLNNSFGTVPNPNNYVVLRNTNTSYAGFGQASYQILPKLTLTGGVRVTYDEKKTRLVTPPRTAAGVSTFPATAATNVRLADTQPSWEASLNYAVDPDVNVFARVSHGFRGPTIQGRNAVFSSAFVTAGSETITSYEAGFKSNLFGNTLRFNATGFYYKVHNIQLNGNDANNNGLLFNANQAQAWGGEAELTWRPVRDFTLGLGGSVLHTEINDTRVYTPACFLNGALTCTVLNPTLNVRNAAGTTTAVLAQINGNALPNAPKYQLDANARYDFPLGNGGKLFIGGDVTLQGYTSFVPYKTVEYTSDGTFEAGLKAGYTAPDGKYELAVFSRNVTNEKNLKGVLDNYNAAVFNDPRIIGVSLSGKF